MQELTDKQLVDLCRRTNDPVAEVAAEKLFHRYAERLIRVARTNLNPKLRRRIDPEDIVNSAYRSFFRRNRDGEFTFRDNSGIWRLLVTITLNKVRKQGVYHGAEKRDINAETSIDSALGLDLPSPEALSREPQPDEAVALLDEVERVKAALGAQDRQVFKLLLEGVSESEIARVIDRGPKTVQRAIARIKQHLLGR